MRSALVTSLFWLFSSVAIAAPLGSWNLNLGIAGGSNATNITSVTVDGTSTIRQDITGGTAFGNSFSITGSLALIQYQNATFNPVSFELPNGYSSLVFSFSNLTGTTDNFGDASFNSVPNAASLYLDDGNAGLSLAGFSLLSAGSSAMDVAYYDGFGGNAFYTLNFQLEWALAGLFTDDQGNSLLPGAIFSFYVDGLLDWNQFDNPYSIPGFDNTSFSDLVNTGEIGAINVEPRNPNPVPEPSSLVLLAIGAIGMASFKKRRIF